MDRKYKKYILPFFPLLWKILKFNCFTLTINPGASQKLFSSGQGKLGQWIKTKILDNTYSLLITSASTLNTGRVEGFR